MNRFLFSLVGLSVLLAGCAETGDNMTPGPTPTEITNEQARALLSTASTDLPDKVGFDMRVVSAEDAELMSIKGAVDNTTGTGYFELKGDAEAMGGSSGGPGDEQASEFFSKGFSLYTTKDGSLYLAEDVAYVFPPSDDDMEGGFVPSPEDSGFAALMNPEEILSNLSDEGVNVTSVKAVTHRGKPAIELTIVATDEDGLVNGTVILFQNPARVAHIEATGLTTDGEDDSPAFEDARLVADFTYDDEVTVMAPEKATRALGLSYTSDANPFGGFSGGDEENAPVTWTFQHDGGIALGEVEVHAKDQPMGEDFDLAASPSLWSMKLSDGTATHDAVTVTFTDADEDGKVSEGDTLQITNTGDEPTPMLLLKDTVTGVYVIPGFGALALLAGLAALALLLRRR